mmetsp:Transcript_21889/g.47119  ORF Transcript_21889/g.47119 Transcript_21889/m.47119 type:complete len:344 (-) Transcript_21889:141-1172(-)
MHTSNWVNVVLLLAACGRSTALRVLAMQKHEYYLREFAMAKPPLALGAVSAILTELQGEALVEPAAEPSMHPFVVPLARCEQSGEVTGLLRWPGADREMPVVRTANGGTQLHWLAASSAKFVHRAAEIAEAEGADTAAALASLASDAGIDCTKRANSAAAKADTAGQVLLNVGPSMHEYEGLASKHIEAGSTQAALITCERNQACFTEWGRPYVFHSRLLSELDRLEEARDVSRHALSLPLWTLDAPLEEVCRMAQRSVDEVAADLHIQAGGQLLPAELRANNGFDKRTPKQIATQRASALLDLAVAATDRYTWACIREQLAELYRDAGLGAFATFVSPDETI